MLAFTLLLFCLSLQNLQANEISNSTVSVKHNEISPLVLFKTAVTTTTTTTNTTSTNTTTTITKSTTTTTTTSVQVTFKAENPLPPLGPQTTPRNLVTKPTPKPHLPSDLRCKLPVQPNYDVDFSEAGYRFYSMREQRLEIQSLPVKLHHFHNVSISFRTGYPYGLLFYAANADKSDFIAGFLLDGYVFHQVWVGGTIKANISSELDLSDGKWHKAEFVRTESKISLIIDGSEQPGSYVGQSTFNVEYPIYVGGINSYVERDLKIATIFGGKTSNYNGCIRDLKFSGAALETEPTGHHVVPCSEQVEQGVFFHQPNSYVKIFNRFTVGPDFSIQFDIRPREPDGLLFSVHGKNSYLILELVDNTLFFTVKSDPKNILVTNYTLPNNGSFCDGKWRNVLAIKSKFVINMAVDFVSSSPGVGNEGSVQTKTNRPLFMGGHLAFQKAPGIKTKKPFKGCIKNVEINKKTVTITPNLIYGDIWHGVCPVN